MRLVHIEIKVYEASSFNELPPWEDKYHGGCYIVAPEMESYNELVNGLIKVASDDFDEKAKDFSE